MKTYNWKRFLQQESCWLVFGRYSVRILAGTLTTFTELFRGSSQTLHACVVSRLFWHHFLSNPFQFVIHQSSYRLELFTLIHWQPRKINHSRKPAYDSARNLSVTRQIFIGEKMFPWNVVGETRINSACLLIFSASVMDFVIAKQYGTNAPSTFLEYFVTSLICWKVKSLYL
jgi:hypothetical protein